MTVDWQIHPQLLILFIPRHNSDRIRVKLICRLHDQISSFRLRVRANHRSNFAALIIYSRLGRRRVEEPRPLLTLRQVIESKWLVEPWIWTFIFRGYIERPLCAWWRSWYRRTSQCKLLLVCMVKLLCWRGRNIKQFMNLGQQFLLRLSASLRLLLPLPIWQ